jgi:hypothetical protein
VAYRHSAADIHWEVHRIVQDQLDYREVCAYWVPKNLTDDDKAHCMGLVSIGHVTLVKEGSFEAETWLITQNLMTEKGCVIENLSTPSSEENGSIVIIKDDHGDTVG